MNEFLKDWGMSIGLYICLVLVIFGGSSFMFPFLPYQIGVAIYLSGLFLFITLETTRIKAWLSRRRMKA